MTSQSNNLSYIGILSDHLHFNLSYQELTSHTLEQGEGKLTNNGTLSIQTGRFTGRSPKDRYIVQDDFSQKNVDWNDINQPISQEQFGSLKSEMIDFLNQKNLYIQDGYACADAAYKLNVRLIAQKPWSAHFVHNMFLRPETGTMNAQEIDWHIICAPEFMAHPEKDKIRSENFSIINFSEKTILIGGTGYTGEIKKGIFSVLNCMLPIEEGVLPMHCSANADGDDTAVFFGLSGTGKTTLSADGARALIGDDEHGWSAEGVFNFEGGCYAKCINLSEEKEPQIFKAIKPGAILENIGFIEKTNEPDFSSTQITQNTRVSYPIYHIDNVKSQCKGNHPKNIFFLTCDAYGVLPPVSKLSKDQAMYHFLSGYTAKVAGTEDGINEPTATFSACYGSPFLPLHPTKYADMLGERIDTHNVNCWLINTGWIGGSFPAGERIPLKYTRAIIDAIFKGELAKEDFSASQPFNLSVPHSCPGVPDELLNPNHFWTDKNSFNNTANKLALLFKENFKKFEEHSSLGKAGQIEALELV